MMDIVVDSSDEGEPKMEIEEAQREGDIIGEESPCRGRGDDDSDGGDGGGGGHKEEEQDAVRVDTPGDASSSTEENLDDASNIDAGVAADASDGVVNTTTSITNNTAVKFRSIRVEDIHTIEDVPEMTMSTDPEEKNENGYNTERNTKELLWYTDKEYFFIKKEAMNTVRRKQRLTFDDSLDDDDDDDDVDSNHHNPRSYGRRTSTRGLEIVDADSKRRRETIIKKAVNTVIETQQEHKEQLEKQQQQQQPQQKSASYQHAMTIANKYHDCVVECESEVEARNRAKKDEQDAHDYLHHRVSANGDVVDTATENNANKMTNLTAVVTSQKGNKLADGGPSLHQRITALVRTSFGRGSLGKRGERKSSKLHLRQAQSQPQPQPQPQKQQQRVHRKMDSTSTTVSVSSSTSTPPTPPSLHQQKKKGFASRILFLCRANER